jgi:hypothetical protein
VISELSTNLATTTPTMSFHRQGRARTSLGPQQQLEILRQQGVSGSHCEATLSDSLLSSVLRRRSQVSQRPASAVTEPSK